MRLENAPLTDVRCDGCGDEMYQSMWECHQYFCEGIEDMRVPHHPCGELCCALPRLGWTFAEALYFPRITHWLNRKLSR